MARRRTNRSGKRDTPDIATFDEVLPNRRAAVNGDRRTFHPEGRPHRPPLTFSGRPAKITMMPAAPAKPRKVFQRARVLRGPGGKPMKSAVRVNRTSRVERWGFVNPIRVLLCLRRKMRRQVLFAFRKTGKGARARKHFNSHSLIRC